MTPQSNQGAPARPASSGLQTFNAQITNPRTQDYLRQVLGERRQEFVSNLTALVAGSTSLQQCNPMTVMYAAIKATALNLPLDPNLGFAYVIPYRDTRRGVTEAQFQIGYKGLIQLAIRSGQFLTINATEVREGELEDFDLLTGALRFKARPGRHELPTVGYVAHFALTNGFNKSAYMSIEEVRAHAERFSKAYKQQSSPWHTDFDAMARKTVLKLLLSHYAPLSIEMQGAVTSDQAVFDADGRAHYADRPGVEDAVATEIESQSLSRGMDFAPEDAPVAEPSAAQAPSEPLLPPPPSEDLAF